MLNLHQAIKMLFTVYRINETETMTNYYEILSEENEEYVVGRIKFLIKTWKPQYGEKIPSIAEIIGDTVKDRDIGEIESAWQGFKKQYDNQLKFEPIPDWVYTMRKLLGGYNLVDKKLEDDETWIKKEFIRIYPAMKAGHIQLEHDPLKNSYLKIDGATMLVPGGVDQKRFHPETRKAVKLRAAGTLTAKGEIINDKT